MSPSPSPEVYSARIIKAGALLADLRALTLLWDGADDCAARLSQRQVLGHGSVGRVRDVLLSDFACWLHAERIPGAPIAVDDVLRFLQSAPPARTPPTRWSPGVAARVARGTLAALRDYGHLQGTQRKTLARPAMPPFAAAFMALHRRLRGLGPARIVHDPLWQRLGLDGRGVEHLLFEAHAHGWLEYRAAGSATRLEFAAPTLEGLVDVFVERRARAA